jgi:hypothetical protein
MNASYVTAGKFDWSLDLLFKSSSAVVWVDIGSSLSIPASIVTAGFPVKASAAGAVTVKPSIINVETPVFSRL